MVLEILTKLRELWHNIVAEHTNVTQEDKEIQNSSIQKPLETYMAYIEILWDKVQFKIDGQRVRYWLARWAALNPLESFDTCSFRELATKNSSPLLTVWIHTENLQQNRTNQCLGRE